MGRIVQIAHRGERATAQGFEAPFEMLHACHERLQRMLALLDKLQSHVREHGADEQARQAARDVMRYFDMAAPEHHRDEELHVFPPLLALGESEVTAVVERLARDHALMDASWQAARQALARLADDGVAFSEEENASLEAFAGLYAGHIDAEEKIAYPRALACMQDERLDAMTRDMMARRGLRAPTG